MTERNSSRCYVFGPFRLDATERRLTRDLQPITLQPKVFDTLALLVENAGHLMTKEALMALLWPDAVVEESNLTKNIWSIRRSLGEPDGGGAYVETVPRVGYRFVASVRVTLEEELVDGLSDGGSSSQPAPRPVAPPLPDFGPSRELTPPAPSRFGPYEILERVGSGGMGQVYRARDERLKRDVAVKVLPESFSTDPDRLRRFEQEAQAAGALNHPNITAVYDVGEHAGAPYMVTELLEGETLRARLAAGPLTPRKAIDFAAQIADALAAAHEKGILHRDLKPDNIFITRSGRVKILDFGLAKLTGTDARPVEGTTASAAGTEPGVVLGTTEYMSPEQVRGLPADPRSDIFSFGIVLYEMLVGRQPFARETAVETMTAILKDEPPEPSAAVEGISPAAERIVHHCLEKSPDERFQSARDLAFALASAAAESGTAPPHAGGTSTAGVPASRPALRGGRSFWIAAVGLAGIVVAAALFFAFRPRPRIRRRAETPARPVHVRHSVAVLGLKNLSGRPDADWLGTALSAMVTAELAAGEQLRVVPAENVARRRLTPPAGGLSAETLASLRSDLNADEIVLGSYVAILAPGGEQIRVDLLVQNAETGETVASVSETGTESDLFRIVSAAGQELRSKLGLGGPTLAQAAIVQASLPADAQATRLYAQGLDRLHRGDAPAARDLLTRAVQIQPDFSLAHAALSDAWSLLGYDGRAEEEAKKAFDLSAGMSREERLAIEARFNESAKKWERAGEIYRTLFDLFPDDAEYGLKLASVRTAGGHAERALEVIAALRRLGGPAGQDPRIDLAAADAFGALSDWPKQMDAADRAANAARSNGATDLVARARLSAGGALDSLGRLKESVAAQQEAARLFGEAGDHDGQARAWIGLANAAGNAGDSPESLRLYRKALQTFQESGDQKGAAHAWSDLAVMDWFLGNVAAAMAEGTRSLEISREIDDRRGVVWGLNGLGNVLADQGQFDKAQAMQEEGVSIAREMKDREFVAFGLDALGDTALSRGDLATALSRYQQALAISREIGDTAAIATHENDLGNVSLARGDLTAARNHYERAVAERERLGQKGASAETRMLLAQVENEEGHAAKALDLARGSAEVFESLHQSGNGSIALAEASQAELALGRRSAAREDSLRAMKVLGQNEQNGARLPVLLAVARAAAASGDDASARSALSQLRKRLAAAHWRAFVLEADLVEAEIDWSEGKVAQARKRLETVAAESRSEGFGLLVRKAETLAGGKSAANPFL